MHVCMLCCFSHVRLCATLWTLAHQAPLFVGFSRQEYCSGFPCLPPGNLPDPGIKPASLRTSALAGGFFITSATWEGPANTILNAKRIQKNFTKKANSAMFQGTTSIHTNLFIRIEHIRIIKKTIPFAIESKRINIYE